MEIIIKDEFIKLGQLLKLAGIAGSGLDAKIMIENGEVMVNAETELRRGKKIREGDVVTVDGTSISVKSKIEKSL